jgi:hypothetical protein
MSTRRPAFKQSQVYSWESEPVEERPSEFAMPKFMNALSDRPPRQLKEGSALVFLIWIVATVCASSVLMFSAFRVLQSLAA